jgi:phosphodiesterase/alkaline phosphatase D-like protein
MRRVAGLVVWGAIVMCAMPAVASASAPSATTGGTSGVTDTAATLEGTVNANGEVTTYVFQYGTTNAYGNQTTAAPAGSGTTNQSVSSAVSGLAPSTTYHYRIVASNPSGTDEGADKTFTTGSAPQKPTVTTTPATNVTATTATANGTVNPHGQTTTFVVQYGKTNAYGSQTSVQAAGAGTTAQNVSAALAGLTPGTTYHYRVVASNASGTTNGNDRSFKTSGTAPAKPVVTTTPATNITLTSAVAHGTVNPKGLPTTFVVRYGKTTSYGAQTPAQSVGAGTTAQAVAAALSGLTPNTTYHFRVVATNALGTTSGGDRSFKTTGAPGPPGVLTGGVLNLGQNGVTLSGAVDPNALGTSYWFEYGLTNRYGVQTSVRSLSASRGLRGVTRSLSGLQSGRTYHYRLVARNSKGTRRGADRTFTTLRPPTRARVRITVKTTPRKARSFPVTFVTRGKLILPSSVTQRAVACAGTVVVRATKGKRVVSSRRVKVKSNCRYRSRFTVRKRTSSLKGKVKIRVRFLGNSLLKPRSARGKNVRI